MEVVMGPEREENYLDREAMRAIELHIPEAV
jgi:hypothetical protein